MKYIDTGKYIYTDDGYVTDKDKRETYYVHNINYLLWALNKCGYAYQYDTNKDNIIKPNPLFRDHRSSYHPYNRRLGVRSDYQPRPPRPPFPFKSEQDFKREIKSEPRSSKYSSFSSDSFISLEQNKPLFPSQPDDALINNAYNWSVQAEDNTLSESKAAQDVPYREGPLYPIPIPEQLTNMQLYPKSILSSSGKRKHEEDDQAAFMKSMEEYLSNDDRNMPNRAQLIPSKKTKKSSAVPANILPDPNPKLLIVPSVKPTAPPLPVDDGTHMVKPIPPKNIPMPQPEPEPAIEKPKLPGRDLTANFTLPEVPKPPTPPPKPPTPPPPEPPPKKGLLQKFFEKFTGSKEKVPIIEEVEKSIETADELFKNNLGLKNLEVKEVELDLENKNPNQQYINQSLGSEEEISPKRNQKEIPSSLFSEDESLISEDLSLPKKNIRQSKLNEKQIKNSVKAIQQIAKLSKSRQSFINQNIQDGVAERLARIPENPKEQKKALKKFLEVSPGKTKMSATQKKKVDNLINELYLPDKEAPRPPVEITKFTNLEQIDVINQRKPKQIPKPKPQTQTNLPPVQTEARFVPKKPTARNNLADKPQGPPVAELGGIQQMKILQQPKIKLPKPQIKKPPANLFPDLGARPKNTMPPINQLPTPNPYVPIAERMKPQQPTPAPYVPIADRTQNILKRAEEARQNLQNLPIRPQPLKNTKNNKISIKNPTVIANLPGQDLQINNYPAAELLNDYRNALTEMFKSYTLIQPANMNIQNAIIEEVLPGGIGPDINKTPTTINALVNRRQRPLAAAKYKPKYLNLWVDVQGRHDTAFDPAISSFSANMDALDIVAEQLKLFINFLDANDIKRMDNHIEKNMRFLAESSKNALSKLNSSLKTIQANATNQSEDFVLRVNGIFDSTRRNLLQAFTHYFNIPWNEAEAESVRNVNFQYSVLADNLILPPKVINELGVSILNPNPNVPQEYKTQFLNAQKLFNTLENETINFFMQGDQGNYDVYVTTLQEAEQVFQQGIDFIENNLLLDPQLNRDENTLLATYKEILKYSYHLGIDTVQRLMKAANEWRKDPKVLLSQVQDHIPLDYNDLKLNLGDQLIVKLNVNDQDQRKWQNVDKFRIPLNNEMSLYYDRRFMGAPKKSSGKVAFLMSTTTPEGKINRETLNLGKVLQSKKGNRNKLNFTRGLFTTLPTIVEEKGESRQRNANVRARYGKFGRGIYIQSNSPLDYINVINKHIL